MRNTQLFIVISIIGCIANIGGDVLAPALPAMSQSLKASLNLSQYSMSIYMLGLALSILFYGAVSEGLGRQKPLIFGMGVAFVGSVLSCVAPNIQWLLFARFVQGLGTGAGACLWRAIFRDVFSGRELAKYSSYITIIVTFILPSGPVLGALLLSLGSWRYIMFGMCVYSFIAILASILLYEETHPAIDRNKLKVSAALIHYKQVLMTPVFLQTSLGVFFAFGAFFSWFTVGPVLLIRMVGITPMEFGLLNFLVGGAFFGSAGFINAKLVPNFGMNNMMRLGCLLIILSGVSLCGIYVTFGLGLWLIYMPILLLIFGATVIWPNAFATVMTPFGQSAGFAGALYSLCQLGGGAVISAIAAYLPDSSPVPLGLCFIVCGLLSFGCFYSAAKHQKPLLALQ